MPLPVLIAAAYLVINLTITIWLVRRESTGGTAPESLVIASGLLRYGPPLMGLLYLITRAGDWPFVLFVAVFFVISAWLLHGLLNYPTRPPKP